jgi:hypothetical protein
VQAAKKFPRRLDCCNAGRRRNGVIYSDSQYEWGQSRSSEMWDTGERVRCGTKEKRERCGTNDPGHPLDLALGPFLDGSVPQKTKDHRVAICVRHRLFLDPLEPQVKNTEGLSHERFCLMSNPSHQRSILAITSPPSLFEPPFRKFSRKFRPCSRNTAPNLHFYFHRYLRRSLLLPNGPHQNARYY